MSAYEQCEVYRKGLFVDPDARDAIVDPYHVPLLTGSLALNESDFTRTSDVHGRSMTDVGGNTLRLVGGYMTPIETRTAH